MNLNLNSQPLNVSKFGGPFRDQIRGALGAFGLSGDDGFKRVGVLKGEKARVALTKALMQPVN